jgi:hypothetical protein
LPDGKSSIPLDAAAVALAEGLHEFTVIRLRSLTLPARRGVEPLLELIENDQHFFPAGTPCPRRNAASVSFSYVSDHMARINSKRRLIVPVFSLWALVGFGTCTVFNIFFSLT